MQGVRARVTAQLWTFESGSITPKFRLCSRDEVWPSCVEDRRADGFVCLCW